MTPDDPQLPFASPPAPAAPASPTPLGVPRITAPLPPRAAQRLDESTVATHDVEQVTRPKWPKLDVDKPDPGFKMGPRQCIGRSTMSGKRCGNAPLSGKERCKFHGGRAKGAEPRGQEKRTRKRANRIGHVGRYHEAMGKLALAYQDALEDKSLTDTREPLAALDAFTRKALARAAENDVPAFREHQVKLTTRARNALDAGDLDALRTAIDELAASASAGAQADESDAVALAALKTFGERVDAYWKTKLDRKQAINARDLVLIFQRIVDIVQAEVTGEAAVRVAKAIDALMLSTQRFDRDAVDLAFEGNVG